MRCTVDDPAGDFTADRASAAAALSVMTEQLLTHLDLEEQYALPLFLSDMPIAEFNRLEAKTRKATPLNRAWFMIPWLVTHAYQDQRAALFRSIPSLRLFYWLNLRYYRRFARALARAA